MPGRKGLQLPGTDRGWGVTRESAVGEAARIRQGRQLGSAEEEWKLG